jgi:excisionase family DNA binding protein
MPSDESGSIRNDDLLKPREVAELFGVTVATVATWARSGRLRAAVSTPGGHRRYLRADATKFLDDDEVDAAQKRMEEDAVRLYMQGWSIRQVAERFECSYGVMRRILASRTKLRNRGGPAR